MDITSKLPNVGTTIFTTMSKMAIDYKAINLGQGFPDFNPSEKLMNFVTRAMHEGHNQYPYMPGVTPLREVIKQKVKTLYNADYDVEKEITVTSGATEAIMAAVLACVSHGDEAIVIEPSYDAYEPAIRLAGGKPIFVRMMPPDDLHDTFWVNWNHVAATVTAKTKLIILNFPNNPTGAIMSVEDLDAIEAIVLNTEIFLLSDEVYEHIVFKPHQHLSVASRPNLMERSFVISSFGKTTHTTGWKVGYCCAPKKLTTELRKIHQFLVFTVPAPFQYALAEYTQEASTYLELPHFYQQKRDLLQKGLSQTNFKTLSCPSTFFLLADYRNISNKSDDDFAIWLTQKQGVTVIPITAFYNKSQKLPSLGLVRFCFAKQDDTLTQAIERLKGL
jgi:methionine aminotransferase